MWYTLAFALVTSIPVDILTLSLWGMLGYLPWLTSLVLITRWERIHTVEKMYRTWFP